MSEDSLMEKENLDVILNGENKSLTKKHIAERQRRARINSYLEEIQKLTTPGTGTTNPAKLEKAEVLERAVAFLQTSHGGVDPNNNSSNDMNDVELYKKGFNSCMDKLFDHVTNSQELYPETPGLKRHLGNFLQNHVTQFDQDRSMHNVSGYNENGYYDTDACYTGSYSEETINSRESNKSQMYNTLDTNGHVSINGALNHERPREVSDYMNEAVPVGSQNRHANQRQNVNGSTVVNRVHDGWTTAMMLLGNNQNHHQQPATGCLESSYRYSDMVVNVSLSPSPVEIRHALIEQASDKSTVHGQTNVSCDTNESALDLNIATECDVESAKENSDVSVPKDTGLWRPW